MRRAYSEANTASDNYWVVVGSCFWDCFSSRRHASFSHPPPPGKAGRGDHGGQAESLRVKQAA
jgi:hypothetical protein